MPTLLRRAVPALGLLLLVPVPSDRAAPRQPAAGAPAMTPVVSAGAPGVGRFGRRGAVAPGTGRFGRPLAGTPGTFGRPLARAPGTGRFGWPLAGTPRPVRRFDPPPQPWLPGHRGVDLAAAPGAEVRAAGAGTVLFAGMVAGRPVVTVGHANGLRTTYEPVRPHLTAGARVAAGAPLGALLAGHPGCPAEACLHWGLRRGEEYLDPLALLGLGPVRLLPLDLPAAAQPRASSVGSHTASRSYSSGVL